MNFGAIIKTKGKEYKWCNGDQREGKYEYMYCIDDLGEYKNGGYKNLGKVCNEGILTVQICKLG